MKLKYYLRGLGIGIVVSTLILGIIFSNKNNSLSDEEVLVRAAQLGMVKSSTLMDSTEALDKTSTTNQTQELATTDTENAIADATTDTENATADATADTENATADATADTGNATTAATEEDTSINNTVTPDTANTDTTPTDTATAPTDTATAPAVTTTSETTTTTVTLSIAGGDSSVGVSNKLENAGLVDSATEFDKYLCANGYDKKLHVGTYQIPVGATEEEIAKIIAN